MILEGGGQRGIFTSGVLDYLMEKKGGTAVCDRSICRIYGKQNQSNKGYQSILRIKTEDVSFSDAPG